MTGTLRRKPVILPSIAVPTAPSGWAECATFGPTPITDANYTEGWRNIQWQENPVSAEDQARLARTTITQSGDYRTRFRVHV